MNVTRARSDIPRARPATMPQDRSLGQVAWPYLILVAAWLPDFRAASEGQGLAIQLVLLGVYGFGLAIFAVNRIGTPERIAGLGALLLLGANYLAVGILSGLARGDSIYLLLRNGLGVFVYLTAAWATAKVMFEAHPARLRQSLAWLCLPYTLAAFIIYNATSGGIDFARIRYQIIGTSSLAALGLLVTFAMFRLSPVQTITMVTNLAILLVSVTRTFLVVLMAQGLVVLAGLRHVVGKRLLAGGLVVIALVGAALYFAGDQVARWQARLGGAGGSEMVRDQTFFTRLSEWEFMLRSWTGSFSNFLFGSGFAARTQYFETRELGGQEQFMIGFGHNQHLSMLFNGGLLGGLPLLLLMIWFGWLAIRFLHGAARSRRRDSHVVFLGAWGATIVIGSLVSDLFAASFILRGQALWYGIGTGLLLGAQARFDPANAWLYGGGRPPVDVAGR